MKETRYVLRIWKENDDWHASFKDLNSKQVRYFTSFLSFWDYFSSEWLANEVLPTTDAATEPKKQLN